jgi:hypothetical protein
MVRKWAGLYRILEEQFLAGLALGLFLKLCKE